MTPRRIRRILFALALLAVPFPYQIVEGGRVPALWLATVAGLASAIAILQGGPISTIVARWLAVQALIAIVLAYVLARLVAALVVRRTRPARQGRVVLAIALGALSAALCPIFASTAVRGGIPTNLIGIFAWR